MSTSNNIFPKFRLIAHSLDLRIFIKYKNGLVVDFILLHLCLKTKNLAFNKKKFSKFVVGCDSKYLKPIIILKSLKMILR